MTTQPVPLGLLDIRGFDAHIRRNAADAARNFHPAPPVIAPLPGRAPNPGGLEKVFDITGNVLDGQNAATAGLLAGHGIVSRENLKNAGRAIDALDKGFFKWAGRVLTPAEEIVGAAGDIQRGVPARIALPVAAARTGARLGGAWAGAEAGAALGLAGGAFAPVTVPLLAVGGGIAGGLLADRFTPGREALGAGLRNTLQGYRGLLNSFNNYAKQPPAGARGSFTGTP